MESITEVLPERLSPAERGKLLNGLVVPRPIAVVSSVSREGHLNVAPFSYFNAVGDEPMVLSFSITSPKPDGSEKDTLRNVRPIEEGGTGEYVINVAASSYAKAIARCGTSLPRGVSEFEYSGLTAAKASTVKAPRVAEAPAWFECRTLQVIEVGRSHIVLGEVLKIGVRRTLIDERLRIDVAGLDPLARLAGAGYCRIGERFDIPTVSA